MVLHHLNTKILCQSAYLKRRPDGRSSVLSLCNGPNNCISYLEIFVRFGRMVVPPLYLQEWYPSNLVRVRVVLYVIGGVTKMCQKFVYVTIGFLFTHLLFVISSRHHPSTNRLELSYHTFSPNSFLFRNLCHLW